MLERARVNIYSPRYVFRGCLKRSRVEYTGLVFIDAHENSIGNGKDFIRPVIFPAIPFVVVPLEPARNYVNGSMFREYGVFLARNCFYDFRR